MEKPVDVISSDTECRGIEQIIKPRPKDLGGFSVRRVLPVAGRRMVGPWIFFDHMGPATFSAGNGIDVRPHPHINLATVTYLFAGEILHRDSLGSVQPIRPGDINLMVAGRGIVHSERERPEIRATDHLLHGLQLWLALPEADEEIEPEFHHYASKDIPIIDIDGVVVRVIMGQLYGTCSPVKTFAETIYAEADLASGQTLQIPYSPDRALYLADGRGRVNGVTLDKFDMAVLIPGSDVVFEAIEPARLAIIGGEKMSERYIEWNFVSSRKQRIEQAKRQWQAGDFDKVPGDDEEYIPLPQYL